MTMATIPPAAVPASANTAGVGAMAAMADSARKPAVRGSSGADEANSASETATPAAFAPLMAGAQSQSQPTPPTATATASATSATDSDPDAVDVLDAALMQALDEMLGRSPAVATPEDEATSTLAPSTLPAATALAMLMPTAIPAAIPAPPAAMANASQAGPARHPGDAPDPLPVSLALTTDTARWMALQADARPAADDAAAWQGLQRWSAELMSAMTSTASMTPVTPVAAPGSASASATAADAGLSAVSSGTLTLPASREAWQQPLMQALGDRLQLQIAQRADSARLHLEPPQLGRIEIDIRQQGGVLQVQFSASHDEVRQQLRQITEPLRQDLVQRHAGEVSVQVAGAQAAGDGRGRDGAAAGQGQANGQGGPGGQHSPQRDAQRQPGRALHDEDAAQGTHGATAAVAFADALDRNTRTL